tara:strand:+ start:286 stop:1359 length:1074 start_codon:yes stop_codon:yes gene_type:complete
MNNNFIDKNNKGLLWNFMFQNGMFTDIDEYWVTAVKKDFDEKINIIYNSNNADTVSLNKIAISEMYTVLNKYKNKPKPKINKKNNITSSEISQEKQNILQKQYNKHEQNFKELIEGKKPEILDFSDKNIDEPIGEDMDNLIETALRKRENDLNMVLENPSFDKEKSSEWINKDNNSNVKLLKIGDTIKSVSVEEKHVTFNINEETDVIEEDNSLSNFLNNIKKDEQPKKELNNEEYFNEEYFNKLIDNKLDNFKKYEQPKDVFNEEYFNKIIDNKLENLKKKLLAELDIKINKQYNELLKLKDEISSYINNLNQRMIELENTYSRENIIHLLQSEFEKLDNVEEVEEVDESLVIERK